MIVILLTYEDATSMSGKLQGTQYVLVILNIEDSFVEQHVIKFGLINFLFN